MVSSDSESSMSNSSGCDKNKKEKVEATKHGQADRDVKSHAHRSKAEDRIANKYRDLEHSNQKSKKSKGSHNAMQRLEQEQQSKPKTDPLEKKGREDKSKHRHNADEKRSKEDEKVIRGEKRVRQSEEYPTSRPDGRKDREDSQSGSRKHDKHRTDRRERNEDYEEDKKSFSNNNSRPSWENNKVRRHAEQIQQRKLLWGKTKEAGGEGSDPKTRSSAEKQPQSSQSGSKELESSWTSMFAAASSDSNQLSKFQRLMGMKKASGVATAPTKEEVGAGELAANLDKNAIEAEKKRQREMTEKLDQQYAVARATTHHARGRGLGFM